MLRIKDKGIEIEKYLEELSQIVPRDFEEYFLGGLNEN